MVDYTNTGSYSKRNSYSTVTTLAKSLSLIELVGKSHGITPALAASSLGYSRATVHRILATLQDLGYVVERDGRYRLTYKLFSLCKSEHFTENLKNAAWPYMLNLSKLTGEEIRLTVQHDTKIVSIEEVRSRHTVTLNSNLLNIYPVYCSASGITLLSNFTDRQICELISEESLIKKAKTTPVTHKELLSLVRQARDQGFCLENGIFSNDINSISAPVFDNTGQIIAAIVITGPKQRLTNETLLNYLQPLLDSTGEISKEFGFY